MHVHFALGQTITAESFHGPYSNMGSHAGRESLDLLFEGEVVAPGPFADNDRFRRIVIVLADEAVLSTLHLMRTMDVIISPDKISELHTTEHASGNDRTSSLRVVGRTRPSQLKVN